MTGCANDNAPPSLSDFPYLERAVARGELLVLAGAGISKLGPSFLPGWFGFNRAILEAAKACALRGLPRLDDSAASALQSLAMEQIAVEAFSDLVVRSFAAEGYFTVLDVLDAAQSNANHRALAALATRGVLKAIVTTNFDTLIERAFREAGVALDVLTAANIGAGAGRAPGNVLYKIHGSLTAADTLVDTVSQKLRGLPEPMRERLGELFHTHHVLVAGYSGGDLKFGSDYLSLSHIGPDSPGFTWLVYPKAEPDEHVIALKKRVGERGVIIEATLPGFFRTLGVSVPDASDEDDSGAQREVERRAADRIHRFFDEPYVGPLSSAAFCVGLLSRTGQFDAAASVRRALAVEVQRWGNRVPKTAAGVFRTLSSGAMEAGDVDGAEHWTRMELAFWDAVKAYLPPELTSEARATWERNSASAWMNLAVVERARGSLADARVSLERARDLAVKAANPGLYATILSEAAWLASQMGEGQDAFIQLMRQSISAAVEDGGANRLARSLVELADKLVELGEYDLAWSEAERASSQMRLTINSDVSTRIEIVRASIEARRGGAVRAFERLRPFLAQQGAGTSRGAGVRAALARLIGHDPQMRSMAIAMLDDVLAAMAAGQLPESGLSNTPERKGLEQLKASLSAGGAPAIAALINVPGNDNEANVRDHIALAEFTNFPGVIPFFYEGLCHMKRMEGRWLRVMDLALGLFHSAKRTGDVERQLEAINLFNVARALEGDVASAINELRETLATAAPGEQRDAIDHNLRTISRAGDHLSAESLLVPEVDTPPAARVAEVWKAAGDQNGLVAAIAVLRAYPR